MRRLLIILGSLLALPPVLAGADDSADEEQFARVAETLSSAGCIELDFLSIIVSDIFNTVDTIDGHAVLADDGRYNIRMDNDRYLYTGDLVYNYSAPNNQVVVERVSPDMVVGDQISFLTRLDLWYHYRATEREGVFRLWKNDSIHGDIPDSMTALINLETTTMQSLSYYDINDELNRVIFRHQSLSTDCADSLFTPDFPDSADVLRL